ncbi:MAG: 4-hydroxybenzoyl-CoA thioesterase [Paracoccaceae bacterium]|jgi:4-hydroxybenzoyl-CoA thioesterase
MSWQTTRLVEFSHCDPAGIVFYPRYFEMINSVVEEYFAKHVEYAFAPMHFEDDRGVPTGEISVRFSNPSRLGEVLNFTFDIKRIGTSSLGVEVTCSGNGQTKFICQLTLVRMILSSGKSDPWPQFILQKFKST